MGAKFEKSPTAVDTEESLVKIHIKKNNTGWFWPKEWKDPILVSITGDKVRLPFESGMRGEFEAIVLDGKIILSEFMSENNIEEIGVNERFSVMNSPQDVRIYLGEIDGFRRIGISKDMDQIIKTGETINVAGIQIRATRSEI